MSLDLFDRLHRSETKFRATRPGPQSISAICPALLAPDMCSSLPPTSLELVSRGCWSEKVEAVAKTPSNSLRPGRTRSSCLRRQSLEYLHNERDGSPGDAAFTDVSVRGLRATDRECASTSGYEASLSSQPHPTSHTWRGQAFSVVSSDIVAAETRANCVRSLDQMRLGESAGRKCATHVTPNLKNRLYAQNQPGKVENGDWETQVCDRDLHGDSGLQRDKLRIPYAQSNASSDAVSAIASSAVLSPVLMPRFVRERTKVETDSDCSSSRSASAYSVEADEMIEMHSGAWKHIFRDVWRKARPRHGSKGQKAADPRCSFTT